MRTKQKSLYIQAMVCVFVVMRSFEFSMQIKTQIPRSMQKKGKMILNDEYVCLIDSLKKTTDI